MDCYNRLKLLLVSGKGGVGKTTLACGMARSLAQKFPNEQVLLLSTDPAHSLGDVLQQQVYEEATVSADLPNLKVQALNAELLLKTFKAQYGAVLELLVERGSFVERDDLSPVWNLNWPGLDELMSILEIQRLFREEAVDRVVVDMAPTGHTLNLFGLMDFLDEFLAALDLFQEKHRFIQQRFTGQTSHDEADEFLDEMKTNLAEGRHLLQDKERTACLIVAIAEMMSLRETQRFLQSLQTLNIVCGGLFINQLIATPEDETQSWLSDRYAEQQRLLVEYFNLAHKIPVFAIPQQATEPVGNRALDSLFAQLQPITKTPSIPEVLLSQLPQKILPSFNDFIQEGRRLILVGGKGGVGKTTIAGAIALGMAKQHPERNIRVISIDPAHSLGDAFGVPLNHEPTLLLPNLSAQEIDAEQVLNQFREDYLWELAGMMSGETGDGDTTLQVAYGPEGWRRIVTQSLPGIDEMLSLVTVIELLESNAQDLIILDTAPTGHLLRFLEMPTAMADWLSWIFKLWVKYQDVLGHVELMSRLRKLRQQVVQTQKKLKDPQHTEFIGVIQAQSAIVAEAQRLTQALQQLGVQQRYVVLNRYESISTFSPNFPEQTLVRLPNLPRCVAPQDRLQDAATLLF